MHVHVFSPFSAYFSPHYIVVEKGLLKLLTSKSFAYLSPSLRQHMNTQSLSSMQDLKSYLSALSVLLVQQWNNRATKHARVEPTQGHPTERVSFNSQPAPLIIRNP